MKTIIIIILVLAAVGLSILVFRAIWNSDLPMWLKALLT